MPASVERTDPDGVDYGRVMQLTFVCTIVLGAPLVVALSLFSDLSSWEARAGFAVRVGSVVWLLTAVGVYAHERYHLVDE